MNDTPTEKHLYKSTITIEVLSTVRINNMNVEQIIEESINGEFSFIETNFREVELDLKNERTADVIKRHNVGLDYFWTE